MRGPDIGAAGERYGVATIGWISPRLGVLVVVGVEVVLSISRNSVGGSIVVLGVLLAGVLGGCAD